MAGMGRIGLGLSTRHAVMFTNVLLLDCEPRPSVDEMLPRV